MKATTATLAAVLAGIANAVKITNENFSVTAGVPFTLTWAEASGPVTVTLKNGNAGNLQDVEVLTSGSSATSLTWTPEESLPTANYAFEIKDAAGVNYSLQFPFLGSASASASASTASSTISVTSSSSASSTSTTSSSASSTESSSVTSSASNSSTTSASRTTTSSATRTSSTSTSTTTAPNANGAKGMVVPFAVPMMVAAAAAYFN